MKQEQRLSALREELTITWERRFASLRKDLAEQIAGLRTELTREIAGLRTELTTELTRGVEGLRTDLAKQRAEIIKWMFVFWAGTVFSVAGLMLAFLRVA
jgi:hypothetical protein